MPELPEVETTRRGISPYLEGQTITKVIVRNHSLRWPIPATLTEILAQQQVNKITRRAKYLLFHCDSGTLLIHLGMSGSLRILDKPEDVAKHDHVDINFDNGYLLRYTDPRRFGAILWTEKNITEHKLLNHLGPEPLSDSFTTDYLMGKAKGRKSSIKTFIMNGKIVVGVGNIYANEALFLAGIHPKKLAGELSKTEGKQLVNSIKQVLEKAIIAGGTTLKDFRKSDGKPGYFSQQLNVYGRNDQACYHCGSNIQLFKESQRATFFCPLCQKPN
ncbi:DNA-formamidopyrimidine glycosylase [Methylophaga sp. 42_25_T18]|nr:DNA-formamidopyrimidine glycosylase [Methylophaga sp. 42_25_T18]OUR89791.1 DNA-formamidopyrimidine glycosylase [Methylophaga sp. 42_8_T64]